MYPASFSYSAPSSLDDALALLAEHGDDAKLLAGGHSLLPMMKLRFVQPAHLVDLRRVAGLSGIVRSADALTIGAMTTHSAVASSADVRAAMPMLTDAAEQIGDPQVRNRGTIGGSIAHADPAADLPAVMLAADAQMTLVGRRGSRVLPANQFFVGMLQSALAADEVLTQIRLPLSASPFDVAQGRRVGSAYAKWRHPASRYALIGIAAVIGVGADGIVELARIGVTGMGPKAIRASAAEKLLVGNAPSDANLRKAAAAVSAAVNPQADLQGDVAYKRHLAAVYTERALSAAVRRATL